MKRSGGGEIFGGDIWEFWHSREPPKCSALLGTAPSQIGAGDEETKTKTKTKTTKTRTKTKKTNTMTKAMTVDSPLRKMVAWIRKRY